MTSFAGTAKPIPIFDLLLSGLKIDWDIQTAGADVIEHEGTPLPERVLESIKKNKVALKAPVTTKAIIMMNPYLSSVMKTLSYSRGRKPIKILLPSSGGIGIRLKKHNMMLNISEISKKVIRISFGKKR